MHSVGGQTTGNKKPNQQIGAIIKSGFCLHYDHHDINIPFSVRTSKYHF
nr:MAG TPA: hypothetical protein [Caudoviricetes sp.]